MRFLTWWLRHEQRSYRTFRARNTALCHILQQQETEAKFSIVVYLTGDLSLGENFVIYTGFSGLARPRLVSGYRARNSYTFMVVVEITILWITCILIDRGDMIWSTPRVFDSQKLHFIQWTRCVMWGFSDTWALSRWRRVHSITAGRHNRLRHEHCKAQVDSLSLVLSWQGSENFSWHADSLRDSDKWRPAHMVYMRSTFFP